MKRITLAAGSAVLTLGLALASPAHAEPTPDGVTSGAGDARGRATLTGFASLPALTYVPGSPISGTLLDPAPVNGVAAPFPGQPVQGFSGVVDRHDGTFDALSDNGFGNKRNSADFLLRVHRIKPDFRSGSVQVLGGFYLTDPKRLVPWPLVRQDRTLTGSDFDIESIVRLTDGTYWIGDEFGPALLHVSATGRLLEPPILLPGVQAPENPYLNGGQPNLGSSKGFEGMARSADGRRLYPLLEGTVAGDPAGALRMYEFDLRKRAYTGKRLTYRLENPANAIGDAITVDDHRFLIIERDNLQGDAAAFKRIYLADARDRDRDGAMDKTLVADLLDVANPKRVGGFGETFRFPFQTIEDVVILDDRTLGVLDDNNFPGSNGRTPGVPDNNEFITIRLAERLHADPRAYRR
ncbi:esterase-like activity of phytase family protein [Spongiactinospora sp. TRM90649]|uniref:esterase-like activity of phytase family protein n=1 Tax=Spongiactinospora sp. TRM90649 TaxID=3031114 RepID=UPI0023F89E2D|nr:esterase-like activity of phytase family protein [Spongiactinospora sp. TRM90649]MDF5756418.1 esterase-like activity of phytase family protein [Spongiactinospora sp. TRM90649]